MLPRWTLPSTHWRPSTTTRSKGCVAERGSQDFTCNELRFLHTYEAVESYLAQSPELCENVLLL